MQSIFQLTSINVSDDIHMKSAIKISFHNDLRKHQIFCQQINAKAGSKVCTVGFFTSLNFLLPLGGRFFKMLLAKIEIQSDRGNQFKINTWLMLT